MFLLVPALYMPGFGKQEYVSSSPHIEIVHGWSDDVVPVDNIIRYARETTCYLHIISRNHNLNDSIEVIERLFVTSLPSAGWINTSFAAQSKIQV